MKIVVVGGSGLVGSKLVGRLRQGNHIVVSAHPSAGINTLTGAGLFEAMEGADVVVDVSEAPSRQGSGPRDFFLTSGNNLVAAANAAGVGHHVVLSIVGTDRMQDSDYFRGKLIQEQLVRESGRPHTILRATQFYEFMERIAAQNTLGHIVRLSPAYVQPIAADDVAETLALIAMRAPANGILELAGPHSFHLDRLVGRVLAAKLDERLVIADPDARYFGVILGDRTLVPNGTAILASTTFDDWLGRMLVMPLFEREERRLSP